MSEDLTIQDGQVVTMDYSLWVDGELVDTSEGNEPIEFLQGAGNIIQGLESQIYGMEIGDTKDVMVSSEDGYGAIDEEAYAEVPRDQFPSEIPLEAGIELEVRDTSGELMSARIDHIGEEMIRLDFNHPLAGKQLHFRVKIVGIRQATEEEIEHGHAHSEYEDIYAEEEE